MSLPLYDQENIQPLVERKLRGAKKSESHRGLLFERFFLGYEEDGDAWKVEKTKFELQWFEGHCGDLADIKRYNQRQAQLCISQQGVGKTFKLTKHSALLHGAGNNHPLETGLTWHPTLAVPYVPASSIKGLLRSFLTQWYEVDKTEITAWFGCASDNADGQDGGKIGALIFHDAIATERPEIKIDIQTPHMGEWYQSGSKPNLADGSNIPADWHTPVPSQFLTVSEMEFAIVITPRDGKDTALAQKAMDLLTQALDYLGLGAKTAVGYGRFTDKDCKVSFNSKVLKIKQQQELKARFSNQQIPPLLASLFEFKNSSYDTKSAKEALTKFIQDQLCKTVSELTPEQQQIAAEVVYSNPLVEIIQSKEKVWKKLTKVLEPQLATR